MTKSIEQILAEIFFMFKDTTTELTGQTSSLSENSPLALDVPAFMADGYARMEQTMKAILINNPKSSLIEELEALS